MASNKTHRALWRLLRFLVVLLLGARSRARAPRDRSKRAGRDAPRGGSPFLVFQDAFSEEQLAFGPGQLADPDGPQVIVVLSTEALVAGLRLVH